MMGVDFKVIENMSEKQKDMKIVELLTEVDFLRRQVDQLTKERNTMFNKSTGIVLPDVVVSQQQKQGVPQGSPRSAPVPQVPQLRPLPNQGQGVRLPQ
jgi:hypothetical protein